MKKNSKLGEFNGVIPGTFIKEELRKFEKVLKREESIRKALERKVRVENRKRYIRDKVSCLKLKIDKAREEKDARIQTRKNTKAKTQVAKRVKRVFGEYEDR